MNVLFLMTLNAGTSYWRMYNPAKHMHNNNGCKMILWPEYNPAFGQVYLWEHELLYDSEKGTFIGNLIKDWADIIVGQRIFTHAGLAVIDTIHHHKKKFLTEIDDNCFEIQSDHPAYKAFEPGSSQQKIAREQLKISDGLIVSTEYLKKSFKKYNKNICVIPNAIDFDLWQAKPKKKRKIINIGYVGGGQHFRDIKILKQIVPEILKKYKNTRFIIWGGKANIVPSGSRIVNIQSWVPTLSYPKILAKLNWDIGLAPLVDNYLNRCKSPLRWLEYSSLEIPTIASPIEPFKNVSPIFLAKTVNEWVDILSGLIESKEIREKIGLAAKEKVKRYHNIKDVATQYIKILEKEI